MIPPLDSLPGTAVGFPYPTAAPEVAAALRSSLSKVLSKARRMAGNKQHRKNLEVQESSSESRSGTSPAAIPLQLPISLGYLPSLGTRVLAATLSRYALLPENLPTCCHVEILTEIRGWVLLITGWIVQLGAFSVFHNDKPQRNWSWKLVAS